ncbi:MAG: dTDP-glucose 4,6-dehydratase [Candidatus Omnitrophica bacterium]|nr:dTDP-glucose 4,6-dehydratase [Candidatus Omnitrophota bacterium]
MRIVVTGGAGFIGSNFIHHILKKYPNYKIVNIDNLTYAGNLHNLKDVEKNKNYKFVKADICDRKKIDPLIKGCDWIIHFAAESHVDRSIESADIFTLTNVLGTQVLLDAAVRHRVKKFIHISTDEVYGSRKKGFFKETDILNPSSPYAASKAASDLMVMAYRTTYGLPVIITRSSNNFGPRQFPEKIIPLFITRLMENKKVPLYAKGENVRDWIFVEDNCRAVDLVAHKGKIGEIYNICAKNHLSNIQLTKKILKRMKKPESMIKNVKDRLGHDFRYAIDNKKLSQLGFTPKYSLEQALDLTVKWYAGKS